MCLLALFFRVVEDAPVVIGANREEAYRRGGEPPRLHGGDWLRVRPLPPGLHVLTNGDAHDDRDARRTFVAGALGQEGYRYRTSADCVEVLRQLCGRHEPGEPPVCLRGDDRGTTSSTIIALRPALAESVYLHAQGPPDRTPYEDYSELLRQMDAGDKK